MDKSAFLHFLPMYSYDMMKYKHKGDLYGTPLCFICC